MIKESKIITFLKIPQESAICWPSIFRVVFPKNMADTENNSSDTENNSSDTENNSTSVLSLEVTQEQRDAIYHFFSHSGWEFKEVQNDQDQVNNEEICDDYSFHGNYFIEQNENFEEYAYCLCRPCITNEGNRQLWWESENHDAHERNSHLRKDKYKRFWTNLFHRGIWDDPRYKQRKREALRRDLRRRKFVYHRRDIMPKCVVGLVRQWYPNPPGQDYMGHMWE